MARGGPERKAGRRRHADAVAGQAGQLALLRNQLDGMDGSNPAFMATLSRAIGVGAELLSTSTRMSRGSLSRRAACENIVTTSVLLANERNNHMSHETAPQYDQTSHEAPARPNLYLVSQASGSAAVAEACTHYDDAATGPDQMPFTD